MLADPAQGILTDDERGYFAAIEDTINSRGWLLIVKELTGELDDLPGRAFAGAKGWEDILQARAREAALAELRDYPTMHEHRKQLLIEARQHEAEIADE